MNKRRRLQSSIHNNVYSNSCTSSLINTAFTEFLNVVQTASNNFLEKNISSINVVQTTSNCDTNNIDSNNNIPSNDIFSNNVPSINTAFIGLMNIVQTTSTSLNNNIPSNSIPLDTTPSNDIPSINTAFEEFLNIVQTTSTSLNNIDSNNIPLNNIPSNIIRSNDMTSVHLNSIPSSNSVTNSFIVDPTDPNNLVNTDQTDPYLAINNIRHINHGDDDHIRVPIITKFNMNLKWDSECETCGSIQIKSSRSLWGYSSRKKRCCTLGIPRDKVASLNDLPSNIKDLYNHRMFPSTARRLNSFFALSLLTFSGNSQWIRQNLPSSLKVHGSYTLRTPNESSDNYYRCVLLDPQHHESRLDNWSHHSFNSDEERQFFIRAANEFRDYFMSYNRIFNQLLQLRDIPLFQECDSASVTLRHSIANPGQVEETAIVVADITDQEDQQRIPNCVVFRKPSENILANSSSPTPVIINSNNPFYDPLSFPILCPTGEVGFYCFTDEENRTLTSKKIDGRKISCHKFYKSRVEIPSLIHNCGRLFEAYMCLQWIKIEDMRLDYFRRNQPSLQNDVVIQTDIANNGQEFNNVKNIYIPASHVGSRRHQRMLSQQGMYIAQRYGNPWFFITMTMDTKHPLVQEQLRPGQTDQHRADIVCKVFKCNLSILLHLLKIGKIFGRQSVYIIHVIEFQKRGRPHAHIVCTLTGSPPADFNVINEWISAEMPDQNVDREAFDLVTTYMLHQCNHHCLDENGNCKRKYPKRMNEFTYFDNKGYCIYRRRNENDSRVVPHNIKLLKIFKCHINVEWSCSVFSIAYLHSYIFKGPDYAEVLANRVRGLPYDEIQEYIKCRYVSSMEACWRLLGFHIQESTVSVKTLNMLSDSTNYRWNSRANYRKPTKLVQYYSRPIDSQFRELLFLEYHELYEVKLSLTTSQQRNRTPYWRDSYDHYIIKRSNRIICAINHLLPTSGQIYFLRLLLLNRSATSDEDIRTVDGTLHDNYSEAARALGLLNDNSEYYLCLSEAIYNNNSPGQLRSMFAVMVQFGSMDDGISPPDFLEYYKFDLYKDYYFQYLDDLPAHPDEIQLEHREAAHEVAYQKLLQELQSIFFTMGNEDIFSKFGLPLPRDQDPGGMVMDLLNVEEIQQIVNSSVPNLEAEQMLIYNLVFDSVEKNDNKLFVLDATAGTGKTFLNRCIAATAILKDIPTISVCTTGLGALSMIQGGTVHSRFGVPIHEDDVGNVTSKISSRSFLGKLIIIARLLIIDEAFGLKRNVLHCVEDVIRRLKGNSLPWGGITILLSGDPMQIPPVLPGVHSSSHIRLSSIISSPLLHNNSVYVQLTKQMRVREDEEYFVFTQALGKGLLGETKSDQAFTKEVVLPPLIDVIEYDDSEELENIERMEEKFDYLEHWVFPDPNDVQQSAQSVILAPTNEYVQKWNQRVSNRLVGDPYVFFSSDEIANNSSHWNFHTRAQRNCVEDMLTTEFLASLNPSGVPNSKINLKVGAIALILRNVSPRNLMMNGTKVVIKEILSRRLIKVRRLNEDGVEVGETFLVPRIPIIFRLTGSGIEVKRKQFPIALAYSLSINKSQSQTLRRVVLDLRKQCFAHGQVFVAFSRNSSRDTIKVLTKNRTIYNVVYPSLLQHDQYDNQLNNKEIVLDEHQTYVDECVLGSLNEPQEIDYVELIS